ncbi:hypothetical protein [Actinomadura sp. 9N407]|uniref:hypothetical protein n=1 Tax=Actinomadura sp. 9N407 TaxID=3375154 RepID=UPI003797E548
MDAELSAWRGRHLPGVFRFDFSRGSLEELEKIVLERFQTREEVTEQKESAFIQGAIRYLGESLVRPGYAFWRYQDQEVENAVDNPYHKNPYIKSYAAQGDSVSMVPLSVLRLAVRDRAGEHLVKAYKKVRRNYEQNNH